MRLFNAESWLWQRVSQFLDVLVLSLLWLFLSLPVFTVGAATAGLYDAAAKCVRPCRHGAAARFWATFRREFKTASLATLVWGGVFALLVWGVWTVRAHMPFQGAAAAGLLAVWFLVLLVPGGALCWMFPLLSRFTFQARALIPTALRMAVGYLPRTFAVVALALASVLLSLWLLVPMLVLPALCALAWTYLMEGVFRRYAPQEEGAEGEEEDQEREM